MLPSSYSFRGRWTCRSTARITSGRERLRSFDRDGVADVDDSAPDHARDHSPPSFELILQSIADLIHAKTGFADCGDLQHGAAAKAHPAAGRKPHHVNPFDRDVLLDRAGQHANRVERLLIGQQHLPLGLGRGMLIPIDPQAFDQGRAAHQLHGFPMARAELDGNDAGGHGLQITRETVATMTSVAEEGTRIERDSMGEVKVPSGAYYGASTERARQNFPISNLRLPRRFIRALAQIKGAAALVNAELGLLETRLANPMQEAAEEVEEGKFDKDFVVDVFQTGSGTSTNTNANEVIANRANEILGQPLGSRQPVHPNDHVNRCQSSNDVIPSAMQLSALVAIHEELVPALGFLKEALERKAQEFMPVVKTGRTHLQDATPIRLGQEFLGYAGQAERSIDRVRRAAEELAELPLGGTAVGTGVNAHPDFAERVCVHLSRRAGVMVHETDNHFQAQATLDAVLSTTGALRVVAVSLWKIGNDLRWFASGPRAGLGEITLPEVQPGSSIMPGKVNPVIVESMTMVVAKVLGNDQTITVAAQSGSIFELNLMMPVAAYCLLETIALLSASTQNLAQRCITGIRATEQGPHMVEQGLMLATALAPAIGYEAAAKIAKEALATGKTIRDVARERTALSPEELDRLLDPARMTEPGVGAGPAGG